MLSFVPLVAPAFDLVLVIGGVMVMLLLFAGFYIADLLARLVKPVPIVGNTLYNFLHNSLAGTLRTLNTLWDPVVNVLARMMWWGVQGVWHALYGVANGTANAKRSALNAYNRALQAERNSILQLQAEVARARQQEQTLELDLIQSNAALTALTQSLAGQAEHSAENYAYQQGLNANAYTDYRLSQLPSVNLAGLTGELNAIQSEIVQLQATEAGNFAKAEADIGAANQLMMQVTNQVQVNDQAYTDKVGAAAEAGAITSVLTQLAPFISKTTTELTECLDPLCNTVTPNAKRLGHLGDLLKGLEDLAVEALLVALAVEAVRDPAGVAHEIVSTVEAVGDGIVTGVRDLIGV